MVSDTRLYGASIAFASGLYSLWSASTGTRMSAGAWAMLLLGLIVVVHGAALLTGYADRLGGASGPLMIGYAVLMLANQPLIAGGMLGADAMGSGSGMDGGMGGGMGGSQMTAAMGWDAGMVALALLMLASGLIMSRGSNMDATDGL
ncbi:hypothetical protein [Halomicrobium salinisoli]|uniref:hypothetical protein n=1 Tax=Halomicrobium salinisoli TaxID=2878391 RepID=UPI001CF01247|nr:hypothetical protein [Halomicrobium salinisoli]